MDRGAWQAAVHGVARVGNDEASKPPPIFVVMYKTCDFIDTNSFGVNSQDSIHNYASGEGTWRSQYCCCSAAQLHLTVCDPVDTRLLCPSLSPIVCSDRCPLSQ